MALPDAETKRALVDADHVRSLTQSDGWKIVKQKLDEKILDLQNISNLDLEKPETFNIQILSRKLAADLLFIWLKNDVYGFIEQQDTARTSLVDARTDAFIEHHEN